MNKHDVDIRDYSPLASLAVIVVLFSAAILTVKFISFILSWWKGA